MEGEGRWWKKCDVNFFAELLEYFYSCLVSAADGWSYSKLLLVMEESFKKWAGHAGMLSGCDAACGASCWKQDTWKRDNASAIELFSPAIWVTVTCMLCRAAQKYSNLMMSVALVELFPYVYHCKVVTVEEDFLAWPDLTPGVYSTNNSIKFFPHNVSITLSRCPFGLQPSTRNKCPSPSYQIHLYNDIQSDVVHSVSIM